MTRVNTLALIEAIDVEDEAHLRLVLRAGLLLSERDVERAVCKVRGLAEGRLVRETVEVWGVRHVDGPFAGLFSTRDRYGDSSQDAWQERATHDEAKEMAEADAERSDGKFRAVRLGRVTRIRRAR